MSDIHQEWKELRMKNGNFISHIDGELAKIEKEKAELKHREHLQDLSDAGAFAMQFAVPFNCCQDDRDILKSLNKAQADRIKHLEDEIVAYKEQQDVDLAIKKNLDEKLDKMTADCKALLVEKDTLMNTIENIRATNSCMQSKITKQSNEIRRLIDDNIRQDEYTENLKSQLASEKAQHEEKIDNAGRSYAKLAIERNNLAQTVTKMDKTIRDLEERNKTLVERLAKTNESLRRSIQESNKLRDNASYLDNLRRCQAKEIKRLYEIVNTPNGSCSAQTQQGMQSKIAKQANEIKRLIDDNIHQDEYIETLKKKLNELTEENAAAKDANANFERGHHKGQEELWGVLQDVSEAASMGFDLAPVYGYDNMSDVVANLTASAFLRKTEEDEKNAAKNIQIGDEVEIFDKFCPDDDPHSDIGIVVMIYEPQTNCEPRVYTVVGPKFEAQIDDTAIQSGAVKKTGRRFNYIPLNYFG